MPSSRPWLLAVKPEGAGRLLAHAARRALLLLARSLPSVSDGDGTGGRTTRTRAEGSGRLPHRRARRGGRAGADRRRVAKPRPPGGRARPRQDPAPQHGRATPGSLVLAHPVHARPHAVGRDGLRVPHPGRGNRSARVPIRAGPDLRERRPHRRDQPRAPEDAGGADGGDGGGAGDEPRASPGRSKRRSSCSPRRTRSSRRGPTRFPPRSSIASSSRSSSTTRAGTRRRGSRA